MKRLMLILLFFANTFLIECVANDTTSYTITIDHANQSFHVRAHVSGEDTVRLVFPVWTPGYYQLMHYAQNISDFSVHTGLGEPIPFRKKGPHIWEFYPGAFPATFEYIVKATRNFVATSYVAADYAYIMPASLIPSINGNQKTVTTITIETKSLIETSLLKSDTNHFIATTLDELYDSPILIGAIETLPAFFVKNKKHTFSGVHLGEFDKTEFIQDLQKIVSAASDVIGDIPYVEYKFLAIGPGQGGIEHTTSTSFSFEGSHLATRAGKLSVYSFLAHEYFHHYNVKRIRPIELGPFDYTRENRTNMLWVSEGITVYYDHLILARAKLCTTEELLERFGDIILRYELSEGKKHQTLADASYNTWSDGPFGKKEAQENKTISVYEKGAIAALLLDVKIRKETHEKKSLDTVMKKLYSEFYITKKRGFTEREFQQVCEDVAETSLVDFFEYIYTLKPFDYREFAAYTGINVDLHDKKSALKLPTTISKNQTKALDHWLKQ